MKPGKLYSYKRNAKYVWYYLKNPEYKIGFLQPVPKSNYSYKTYYNGFYKEIELLNDTPILFLGCITVIIITYKFESYSKYLSFEKISKLPSTAKMLEF